MARMAQRETSEIEAAKKGCRKSKNINATAPKPGDSYP
jgi:hypothetical protein